MVDITDRLEVIRNMLKDGLYFCINRGRQYGKTTTLKALKTYIQNEYVVLSLDFQTLENTDYSSNSRFAKVLADRILQTANISNSCPPEIIPQLKSLYENKGEENLANLFRILSHWCEISEKPIVLIIDEVDQASNNEVFLNFLSQLRSYYLNRDEQHIFKSVILASVYDIRHLKLKIRSEETHRENSPWNIAVNFELPMELPEKGIESMLIEYQKDNNISFNAKQIAGLIFDYTAGYPVLVSNICKTIDETISYKPDFSERTAWCREGVLAAIKLIQNETSPLFESLIAKIREYPTLHNKLEELLINGQQIAYDPDDDAICLSKMFGFIKVQNDVIQIANRIFENRIYALLLKEKEDNAKPLTTAAQYDKNSFIRSGHLDMEHILERFAFHFNDIYGKESQKFSENEGRRLFLLFVKPIINGVGNYYIEAQTRNLGRTDLIIDYNGEQIVIELKIWHGNSYNQRGEQQLAEYLEYFNIKKGYMLSFCFNKNKATTINRIHVNNKEIFEVVV